MRYPYIYHKKMRLKLHQSNKSILKFPKIKTKKELTALHKVLSKNSRYKKRKRLSLLFSFDFLFNFLENP